MSKNFASYRRIALRATLQCAMKHCAENASCPVISQCQAWPKPPSRAKHVIACQAALAFWFVALSSTRFGAAPALAAEKLSSAPTNKNVLLWPNQPRADYAGRLFQMGKAPRLRFERRSSPHLRGLDYAFAWQTARGGALAARFPAFALSDRRIHVSGPWYNDQDANEMLFSRGITSIESMPNFRLDEALKTNVRRVPRERKWQLMGDPLFWNYAAELADELAKANAADARIAALRKLATAHLFSDDKEAYLALGRYVWQRESGPTDARNQGMKYVMIDIEQTGGWEHQRNCFGWLYRGMAQAAATQNLQIVPVTYGQWTFEVGAVHNSTRQKSSGLPEYLAPEKDFLAAPDPTLEVVNDFDGVISMDGYLQAIWGDEPFYKRTRSGQIEYSKDGQPVFNDLRETTLYGQKVVLEAGEAEQSLQEMYRQATRMYLMHFRRAGAYPSDSALRKPFLRRARIGAWSRYTNEGLQGIVQNDRPLPAWQFETLVGLYLMTADDIVIWSSDFNNAPGAIGGDYSKSWKQNAHGVVEPLIKAAHRYSALEPIHHSDFEWCWFHLPTVDKNAVEGERFEQKPLVIGKIRQFEKRSWLELFASWPALDGNSADLELWVEQNGRRSKTYKIQIANGRSYFYDAWQLPANFKNLRGENIWLRFRDQSGQTRTWRGDWRMEANNSSASATPKASK